MGLYPKQNPEAGANWKAQIATGAVTQGTAERSIYGCRLLHSSGSTLVLALSVTVFRQAQGGGVPPTS
jgi:hypothetical protein